MTPGRGCFLFLRIWGFEKMCCHSHLHTDSIVMTLKHLRFPLQSSQAFKGKESQQAASYTHWIWLN